MSHQPSSARKPLSIPEFRARKGGEKLVLLTAYTAPMAELLDAHCDMLMVGDSLGMVVYGMDSTLPVTLEMMIAHGAAVVRRARQASVVVDLPFGSYQASPQQAFESAARVLKETGCAAVKMEGGSELAPTIAFLSARGVPVMAHVGLMPQHQHTLGGFKAQGKDSAAYRQILEAAKDVAEAGAFAVVLEGVMEPLAREITAAIRIPTIGIGASAVCDGQVLVVDDMLGMFEHTARFVKKYADLRRTIGDAAAQYAAEVRSGQFPTDAQCYGVATASAPKLTKKK
ncbi:MAG: 3-methyl-2-oxobutanoate hydroxymethyltransferase [Azospirillum brasilense]|nr:MAG: 3-methyl-2-oxobutanoate hydroxymethyltransferase [Azospirillum brasilense]